MVGLGRALLSASGMEVEVLQFDPESGGVLLLYSQGMDVEDLALYSGIVVDQSFLAPWLDDEMLLKLYTGEQLFARGMEVEV